MLRSEGRRLNPFLSPDGRWVAFVDHNSTVLWRAPIQGGQPERISHLPGYMRGASWGPDGEIVFGVLDGGLHRVASIGGEPERLTTPDSGSESSHIFPTFLPGGEAVLFSVQTVSAAEKAKIAVVSLRTGDHRVLELTGSHPRYATSGHVVYGLDGKLIAAPFDLERLEVAGEPVTVMEGVLTKDSGGVDFELSEGGSLAYVTGGPLRMDTRSLVWVDRQGREEALALEPGSYSDPSIASDGQRVALGRDGDIWTWDLARETLTPLSIHPSIDWNPVWVPQGHEIVFSSSREGSLSDLFIKAVGGTAAAHRLISGDPIKREHSSVSPDGGWLVLEAEGSSGSSDLWRLSMSPESSAEPLLVSEFDERSGVVSPDGRWLAYVSDRSGEGQVFVCPFPPGEGGVHQLISPGAGENPRWAPDGREIFYLAGGVPPTMMAVAVPFQTGPDFQAGTAEPLFEAPLYMKEFDVARDGRFLIVKLEQDTVQRDVVLVQNWFEELKRLVPTD